MKFIINRFSVVGLLFLISGAHTQAQPVIEVFTDMPALIDSLPDARVIHFDLSAADRLKGSVLPRLSPNQEQAMLQAKAFFTSPAGIAFKNDIREALRGQQKMIQYQLKKIPAVVFDDGQYVVYGSTDVVEARRLYRLHLRHINSDVVSAKENP